MEANKHQLNSLKVRFTSDMRIPIGVFEDEYFEYFLVLYEESHKARTKWNNLVKVIDERFNGNPDAFLEHYADVRNRMIEDLEKEGKGLLEKMVNQDKVYDIPKVNVSQNNVFNESNVGNLFLSIDLRKANFQAFLYAVPLAFFDTLQDRVEWQVCKHDIDEIYRKWVSKYTDLDYVVDSKYTRQVVFGKLNPKVQIHVEKWLVSQVLDEITKLATEKEFEGSFDLVSFCTDELVFKIDATSLGYWNECKDDFIKKITESFGIAVKCEVYELGIYHFMCKGGVDGHILPVFVKRFAGTDKTELKSCPETYYAQVTKLLRGEPINEKDRTFYHEKQLARFLEPISLVLDD